MVSVIFIGLDIVYVGSEAEYHTKFEALAPGPPQTELRTPF